MSALLGAVIALWPVVGLVSLGLLWLAWKRLSGWLRVCCMLAAGAPAAFLLCVAAHNGITWLFASIWGAPGFEEPVFFIAAVILCPLALAAGLLGALLIWLRRLALRR